jgi:type II secretory pathway pseudopilin PulG
MQRSGFNLTSLLVIIGLLGLLSSTLFPSMSSAMGKANMASVAARGKDIYVAITAANAEREALELPPVWPRSTPPTNSAGDISQINFTNSTDYFYALYDGEHVGTEQHNPYVKGFDYSKLAAAGVPAHSGKGRLKPENNLWTIAKNVREDMDDIIPLLITRNLAAGSLVTDLPTVSKRRLCFDEEWMDPFRKKGYVMVRKGGGTFSNTAKYARVDYVYNNRTFQTTVPGSLPLCYLTPNKEVTPSEATYQACVTSEANPRNTYQYWLRDQLEIASALLPVLLIMGIIPGIYLILKASADKNLYPLMSVAGLPYWLLLWLAVMLYMFWPMLLVSLVHDSPPFVLVVAPVFQLVGWLYLVVWKRMTGNQETYRAAFRFLLAAPFFALICLGILTIFSMLSCFIP